MFFPIVLRCIKGDLSPWFPFLLFALPTQLLPSLSRKLKS